MYTKLKWGTHLVVFFNPFMLVVALRNNQTKSEASRQLCSVKSCSGDSRNIPRELFMTEHILKAHNYAEYELYH